MQEQPAAPVKTRKASNRGRPKDPDLESKVYAAAIKLYSDLGWAGFNFEQIAKIAGVGKAAIYSRWSKREDLLVATFDLRWQQLAQIDTGSLREDLRAIANHAMNRFSSSNIAINMQADGKRYEEFRELTAPFSQRTFQYALNILERAVRRGELSAQTDLHIIVHTIFGSIGSRIGRVDATLLKASDQEAKNYVDGLIDMLVDGLERPSKSHTD